MYLADDVSFVHQCPPRYLGIDVKPNHVFLFITIGHLVSLELLFLLEKLSSLEYSMTHGTSPDYQPRINGLSMPREMASAVSIVSNDIYMSSLDFVHSWSPSCSRTALLRVISKVFGCTVSGQLIVTSGL